MRIGADYYPEHWEKERWKTDAEMMISSPSPGHGPSISLFPGVSGMSP